MTREVAELECGCKQVITKQRNRSAIVIYTELDADPYCFKHNYRGGDAEYRIVPNRVFTKEGI